MTKNDKELRNNAVYSAYSENNKKKALGYVRKIIKKRNLNKFYRYRPAKEYEIESLEKEEIYLCKPCVYEDNNDCKICFDDRSFAKNYAETLNFNNASVTKEQYVELTTNFITNNPKTKVLKEKIRSNCLIACFTEDSNNKYMWENYAESYTGICVEYDFKSICNAVGKNGWDYMPVRYVENRDKQGDIIFTVNDYNFDEALLKYKLSCMTKNNIPYNMEQEWRLLSECPIGHEKDNGLKVEFIKPSRIIMGKGIRENQGFYKKVCEYKEKNTDVEVIEYEE